MIKHIDMFVLPVDGKNSVFLADYSAAARLQKASEHVEDEAEDDDTSDSSAMLVSLDVDAMIAMNYNARVLRDAGISVIRVPALGATVSPSGIYFPTTLNGLYVGAPGNRSLLIPKYDQANPAAQQVGRAIMARELKNTRIVEIEATAAATQQGAIHCLTIELPGAAPASTSDDRIALLLPRYQRRAEIEETKAAEQFVLLRGKWDDDDGSSLEVTASQLIWTQSGDTTRLEIKRTRLPSAPLMRVGVRSAANGGARRRAV